MERIPILLDTDPGNDIDDALAIAYLLAEPRCELVGITTVTGDTARRAAIAEVLCNAAGRSEIPIYAGREEALAHGPGQRQNSQYEAIAHLPHRLDRKPDQAVDFMRETIRSRPGEITLLTIGPMANVALLFAIDPEIPNLLKGLVSMAGAFWGYDNHEWNCKCDPAACGVVTASARPFHTWFGLDVTMQAAVEAEDARRRLRGPVLDLVALMAEKWFEHASRIVFHDPLAAAAIFHPSLCTFRTGRVRSTPEDAHTSLEEGEGIDRVADSVEAKKFFEIYFETVSR